jgi:D-alanyl-D-alanine carboxypeptidase
MFALARSLYAAAGVLSLATPLAGQSSQAHPTRDGMARLDGVARSIDSLASDAVRAGRFSSVSVGVVRGRDTVLLAAHGLSDRERSTAAGRETEYRLASVTKQFTSSIVLQLAGEGRLSLDDSAGKWLPQLPAAWRGVRIAQLLDHTSGIPSYTALGDAWARRWAEDMAPDTIIALTAGRPLDFAPGTRFRYNNTAYVMLGRIIELATGSTYEMAVQDRLARPLGLSGLGYCPSRPVSASQARPYDRGPSGTFTPAAYLSMTQPYAAGALCGTARDLVAWNAALHGGRVVPAALYARMTTPEGAAAASRYAFGLTRDTIAGRGAIVHNGGVHGGSSENWYFPDDSTTIVVLANTGNGGALARLVRQMARAAYGVPLVPRPAAIPLTGAQRAMYVGRYDLAAGERTLVVHVREEGDGLVAHPEGQFPLSIGQIAPHTFVPAEDEGIRLVFTVVGDRATQLELQQGSNRIVGQRVGPPAAPPDTF